MKLAFSIVLILFVIVFTSSLSITLSNAQNPVPQQEVTSYEKEAYLGTKVTFIDNIIDLLNKNSAVVTALSTFVIAVFTVVLWGANRRQSRFAKQVMIVHSRAFVFPLELTSIWELDPQSGLYNWRFRPLLRNSGYTPTRRVTFYTECLLRNTQLAAGYNFAGNTSNGGTGMLAPQSVVNGAGAPNFPNPAITPGDLLDVQSSKKFLYLWGWIKYQDVFPDTPMHITRFCWRIHCTGNPLAFQPGITTLNFAYSQHFEGNCADDECSN